MSYDRKIKIIKSFLFVFLGLIITALIVSFLTKKEQKGIQKSFESSSKLLYGKGISFVEYHEDKRVYSISIDNIYIERARIGPFAIGPLQIAHLSEVNIDLYLDGIESKLEKEDIKEKISETGKIDFSPALSDIKKNLPFQELKKIKGIKIDSVAINLWEKEERVFRISSDTATVDRKTGDLIFTGRATIDAGKNGKLQSYRIRWNRTTRLFRVVDSFYLTKDGRKIEGKEIETDYLLKRIRYQK